MSSKRPVPRHRDIVVATKRRVSMLWLDSGDAAHANCCHTFMSLICNFQRSERPSIRVAVWKV
eukprot:scaffold401344_cov37-Prasinocladus_malaysianus.AAC.1